MGKISDRLKSDEQALLDGYKPAIASIRGKSYEDLKQLYPYIQSSVNPKSLIFFQTEEHKNIYLKRTKDVIEGSPEFEYILGTTLGFPAKAARWFSQIIKRKQELGELPPEKKLYGVGVYWAGFTFVSNVTWLDEDISYMWNTYDHPKAVNNSLFLLDMKQGFLEIDYGDLRKVNRVQEGILKERGLAPTVTTK